MNDRKTCGSDSGAESEMLKGDPFRIVQEIERILADEPDDRVIAADSIEFPLKDALALIPQRYLKDVDPEDIYGETVLVTPDNLFEQLARGKVEVPLSKLAYYIPLHLIYHAALDEEGSVVLPLKKVVKAIGLDEFKKRTPENFRIYDISVFDDPFKESEAVFTEDSGLILDEPEEGAHAGDSPLVLEDEQEAQGSEEISEAPAPSEVTVESVLESRDRSSAVAVESSSVPVESILYPVNSVLRQGGKGPVFKLEGRDPAEKIDIRVPDILQQLRRGVVTVSLTSVVESAPEGLLLNEPGIESGELVTLDIKEAVKGVGLDVLIANTPSARREYDIDWMADPFEEPEEKADLASVRAGKKEKRRAADAERAAAPVEAAPAMSPKIMAYKPAMDKESELDYYELPGNININAASVEELMLLKGMDREIAEAIVAYRNEHSGFKSVFDLFKVDGVDEVVFRQMTGMKAEQKRRHRRRRLASLLNISTAQVADLSAVAGAVARKSGFSACIISDMDGLVLASAGTGVDAAGLSAVLPVTLRQISHNMEIAGLNLSGTVSFAVEGQLYTVQWSGNVILAAAHAENMISESDLSFIRKAGHELAWLLSVRAYAGPFA